MSACEESAEVYASLLVGELADRIPGVQIEAVGGNRLERSSARVVESSSGLSVVGIAEGISSYSAHARLLSRLRRRLSEGNFSLAILIDYPGFHLRVAAAATAAGIPVLYYVAPQLWAWGAWRLNNLRKQVSHLAVVLPFEEEFFRSRGVDADFVGHPLLDLEHHPSKASARLALGYSDGDTVLGLLPGSRHSEISRLWPCFRDAAKRLVESQPGMRVLVAAMPGVEYAGAPEFEYHIDRSATVLGAADAALCKSGTATLEAALSGTPMVIAYRMHGFTYAVARLAVHVRHVGLVNLVAGRGVCPELLQSEATPLALASAVSPLLDCESAEHVSQLEALKVVKAKLGGPGASARVADLAARFAA